MPVISVIQPKIPKGKKWQPQPLPSSVTLGYPGKAFFHKPTKLLVISAVESARQELGREPECTFHISISKNNKKRCSPEEALFVLRAFDLKGAEEDNHVPYGIARNFWRPVAEQQIGQVCACKDVEPAAVEDKSKVSFENFL